VVIQTQQHSFSVPAGKAPLDRFPQPRDKRHPALSPCEREAVLTIADDEQLWHVFSDSARLTRTLLRIAERWRIQPRQMGTGYEFELPLRAVRFAAPPAPRSDKQRVVLQRGTEALQKARIRAAALKASRAFSTSSHPVPEDTGAPASPVQAGLFPQTPAQG
jgi:hypothetical protein